LEGIVSTSITPQNSGDTLGQNSTQPTIGKREWVGHNLPLQDRLDNDDEDIRIKR
jgi:hypothetical protein